MTVNIFEKIERERLALQSELDSLKTQEERNKLGQFSTPPQLATSIVEHTLKFFPKNKKIRFIDPAFGTGSFGSALFKSVDTNRIEAALGCEIDKHYWEPSKKLWKNTKLDYRLCDFTQEIPPSNEKEKYNFLICNPPYVRHHHLNGKKDFLKTVANKYSSMNLSGLAGLYCYFMAISHAWLQEGAISAWLIPSEFMNVNYGKEIQRYLLEDVSLLQIHRFDPEDVQFDDALVSSAIVWFKKEKPLNSNRKVLFTFGGTIETPKISKYVSINTLKNETKWTRFPKLEKRNNQKELTLGDYFEIKRGIATGANSFFILTEEEIIEKELPFSQFKPILPSPRYLETNIIEKDRKGYPKIKKRLFVLDSLLSMEEIKEKYPSLYIYLQKGIEQGIPSKYLCSKRKIWYSQEQRKPSLFYCTYIGRVSKGEEKNPFQFILNHSKAIVNNSYQNLYPKPFVERKIKDDPQLAFSIIEELKKITGNSMIEEGRVYGGGMHKLEPKELAKVPANGLSDLLGEPPKESLI